MILIADGGSTKCDWILLNESGEIVFKTRTEGLNPAVFEKSLLEKRVRANAELTAHSTTIDAVHFYGAGCGTEKPAAMLKKVFEDFFVNADVLVREDMVAAVYAATTEPGIVCILGTGSNSCYYDGDDIHMAVDSLGYILMDEASGNYFGKRLIRDYYYKRMPPEVAGEFEKRFDLSSDSIKENLYKKENPNTYLASFAEFIFTSERNGYFYKIITEGIQEFVETRVLCFPEAQNVPVHFIGSIAHFSEDIIRAAVWPYHLTVGNIVRRPIDGIIDYYRNDVLKKKPNNV
ncbi:N-acetylglucosamine kinase [Aquimarina sp. BL5]|uniref:BadF/BadG/BcrA/BcrD ATPase family protein n=1 Tax=Aquimarina sp. BL5 TaxID=1714860 RepID=UPI000E4BC8BB|nr:BadF/BadG/BcrA/BcrD ATPase family protein [Aquimarina sp. BL5]AXT53551.1 N-acetylglucosamine kinase [Aquimarina sp. BL5]RKN06399.1 N-acetylglucosamine kinase [Aquimarina sp. BL5]